MLSLFSKQISIFKNLLLRSTVACAYSPSPGEAERGILRTCWLVLSRSVSTRLMRAHLPISKRGTEEDSWPWSLASICTHTYTCKKRTHYLDSIRFVLPLFLGDWVTYGGLGKTTQHIVNVFLITYLKKHNWAIHHINVQILDLPPWVFIFLWVVSKYPNLISSIIWKMKSEFT